jgi:CRP/FNR family cyclic AMP-dependent transcriptional regulator
MMKPNIRAQLDQYFAQYPLKTYAKGAVLTFAGHDPEGVSLLESGIVEQYEITPEGNKLVVNVFKPSAFFPMSWAINRTPNAYFFGAVTDVILRQADVNATVAFLQAHPEVLFDLLSRVYKGTDALLRRLVLAASGVAISRLMFELLIEAYRFGAEAEGQTRLVHVKQSVLAERSGLARETVSRELQKLAQEKLVVRTKQGMVIDVAGLEHKLGVDV